MNTFFPSTITEWNELDMGFRNSNSLNIFKDRLLKFAKPLENSVNTCHNAIEIEYPIRLRFGFSRFCYHKFKHGFIDAVDSLCSCSSAIGNAVHCFLYCPNFSTVRTIYLNKIGIIDRPVTGQIKIIPLW